MGLFKRNVDAIMEEVEYIEEQLHHLETRTSVAAISMFVVSLLTIRMFSASRVKALGGKRVVDMHALNNTNLFKEIFMAYLQAAVLEPVLAIASMGDKIDTQEVIINVLTLGSIFSWIWLVSDAFNFDDVAQFFKFHVELREERDKDPKRFWWFRLKEKGVDAEIEKRALTGSVQKDVALWFLLACIFAAWIPGIVTHRDVLHAYVIVFLWAVMHHSCRQATAWSAGYLSTFIFPSTALMPLEYCLPLMDVSDFVEDLEFVESYREFILERTGVELIIEA